METITAMEKMKRARRSLMYDHPFFSCLVKKLKLIEVTWHPTAATYGKRLIFNPKFIHSMKSPQILFVLAHEVLHCALGHIHRRGNRDPRLWNMAIDYAANRILVKAGFKPPKDCLYDSRFDGMSCEAIYKELKEMQREQEEQEQEQQGGDDSQNSSSSPKDGQGGEGGEGENQETSPEPSDDSETGELEAEANDSGEGQNEPQNGDGEPSDAPESQPCPTAEEVDPGQCGGVIDPEVNEEEAEELQKNWKHSTAQAFKASQDMCDELKREVKEFLKPDIPWTQLFRDFLDRSAANDYNWLRPNKKYVAHGMYLPQFKSDEIPEVAIGIDSSLSITDSMMKNFCGGASDVLYHFDTLLRIMYCHTSVWKEVEYTRQDMPIKPEDSYDTGGTDFRPVFQNIEDKQYNPTCLVYFTDLMGTFPEQEPEYPVLWLVPKKYEKLAGNVPFGDVVIFDTDKDDDVECPF